MPGDAHAGASELLARAAAAHLTLLERAVADSAIARVEAARLLSALFSLVERLPSRALRQRFLLDPAFIKGLHAAAGQSRSLASWHGCIAEPSIATVWPTAASEHADRLANSWLALLLREEPNWRGRFALRTDLCGRLRFPLSDWSIELGRAGDRPRTVLADECVTASFTRHDVRLALPEETDQELLLVPRDDWLRMIVGNDGGIDGRRMSSRRSEVRVQLQFAGKIPGWQVRYDPVALADPGHAGLTGGLAAEILGAIRCHSASIASEFDRIISVIRGWELPPAGYGTIHSFSDPTLPRVMGFNVPYTAQDEPQVSPFCFTWFGHELGHTKSYLIETILHVLGLSLASSHGGYTAIVKRYGRRLPIRTLLQIPYTHLYEWVLLTRALEKRFSALPWTISDDPIALGDEIHLEIEEAFDRIGQEVEPTACGHAVLARLWALSKEVLVRWQRARGCHMRSRRSP
jgi:hypothetical protein